MQMVGIWCMTVWQQLGCPPALRLVELGPGRGTLMADLLRGTAPFKPFAAALQARRSAHFLTVTAARLAALPCLPSHQDSYEKSSHCHVEPTHGHGKRL
jgi:NADH dehydrogenase [ubiquinone] 1 alpha subcomplex assembly factor 7